MPRALALVRDGVLVAEPPHLWFCRDKDGDGKCDEKIEVATDYGSQANPEHTANGLLEALDNWIYSAIYTFRLRNTGGRWVKEPTINPGRGELHRTILAGFSLTRIAISCALIYSIPLSQQRGNHREVEGPQ